MKVVAVLYPGGPAAKETPELVGCAENVLGLREMVESRGHQLVALTNAGQDLDQHLPTADVLIVTPFWPRGATPKAYVIAWNAILKAEHLTVTA